MKQGRIGKRPFITTHSGVDEARAQSALRRAAEADRIASILGRAAPPPECGPEMPVAPARGSFRVFDSYELLPGGGRRHAGYQRRRTAALADVFDRMDHSAREVWRRAKDDTAFLPLFTPGQIAIARRYRQLVENHGAGGVKCSSIEAQSAAGGRGGDFMDAFLAEAREIDALQRRIGSGVAMEIRRRRPSSRGRAARGLITDRALADAVCLGDKSLTDVLKSHGWAAHRDAREALRRALVAILDRMQGYSARGTQNRG